jgi:endonuclease/exonuclease/phosphatase family metal-dependent hydrolase
VNRSQFLRQLTLLAGATVAGCATGGSRKPGPTLRALTYNIHHGEGLDGQLDLIRIAQSIKDSNADLVALQEVDRGADRTGRRDLLNEIAYHTGLTPLFGKNIPLQGGDYGNAILSRYPIRQSSNLLYRAVDGGEQRGLLQAVVDVDDHPVVFCSTHLDHRADDATRRACIPEILKVAGSHQGVPFILAGDFNDQPGSRFDVEMNSHFKDAWRLAGVSGGGTYPTNHPDRRIDFIWIHGSIKALAAEVRSGDGSDHLPLLATLQLT